jgi:amidohydrolase
MRRFAFPLVLLTASLAHADSPWVAEIKKRIGDDYARLDAFYKDVHANPELAMKEVRTAAKLAKSLRDEGIDVTEKVGVTGVVGVLKNGKGPVLLIRADMDALPVTEKTGLPYASKVQVRDDDGQLVGVMHACGHDVNVTCLTGAAKVLVALKDRWRGTIVFIGQPAEETGMGAAKMLEDGLFERFPKPDFAFALHCDGRYPAGHVNFREGKMQANVDSIDILVRGKGGHGAAPHTTIDPVVLAARIVLDLQTISSRERDPQDPIAVTVGVIQGGTKRNVIPNDVRLQLTVRTTNEATRKEVLDAIARIAKFAALGARAPEPVVTIDKAGFTPALYNDVDLTKKTVALFRETLGEEKVHERPMSLGGEDFSQFVRRGVTGFYWHLGTVPMEAYEASKKGGPPLANTHSDRYAPLPEPTIRTGVLTMSLAAIKLLEAK